MAVIRTAFPSRTSCSSMIHALGGAGFTALFLLSQMLQHRAVVALELVRKFLCAQPRKVRLIGQRDILCAEVHMASGISVYGAVAGFPHVPASHGGYIPFRSSAYRAGLTVVCRSALLHGLLACSQLFGLGFIFGSASLFLCGIVASHATPLGHVPHSPSAFSAGSADIPGRPIQLCIQPVDSGFRDCLWRLDHRIYAYAHHPTPTHSIVNSVCLRWRFTSAPIPFP